eukprot:TRINITY_DN2254_c0_g1_i1.p1 TRINITY_DN2254_c0_g1~~TRINITY_DN2254_c0_g1_i1.p1  ORF type:complete len:259 (-),score=56.92 TRINITY_DN2254_c0_g1_i1:49-768(-)
MSHPVVFDMNSGPSSNAMPFFPTNYASENTPPPAGQMSGSRQHFATPTNSFHSSGVHRGMPSPVTGAYEDEPPLLEELGINFQHIRTKSMSVLNPMNRIDAHIMDDTDLAGPLFFCLLLGGFLLLTGKVQFGYIYGLGGVGCVAMYFILNLMSENGIDIYRVISVLGYCLLPMVLLAFFSLIFPLNGIFGYVLAGCIISWCTHSASLMFVRVLSLVEQRMLVAYPAGLLYACFALLTIF